MVDTNHVGDIAEQAVILKCLEFGWGVCAPVGNRLPYDLIVDSATKLARIQVKSAWLDESSGNYVTDNRRTKTNRRRMIRDHYSLDDFDIAVVYLADIRVFYVMPVDVFIAYGSSITFVESTKRQRKPKSAEFRDRWDLISTNI